MEFKSVDLTCCDWLIRLTSVERLHKNEMAQVKMRHDQQLAMKTEEISTVQAQLSRAKRERDTFRQMVDSAQRAIGELKSRGANSGQRGSVSGLEEAATGAQAAVSGLQARISSLEDELAEARRETSHAKTEFVTEKSQWEMRVGEMQQKINEVRSEQFDNFDIINSPKSKGNP
jgi:chromosome segregation ATPase